MIIHVISDSHRPKVWESSPSGSRFRRRGQIASLGGAHSGALGELSYHHSGLTSQSFTSLLTRQHPSGNFVKPRVIEVNTQIKEGWGIASSWDLDG